MFGGWWIKECSVGGGLNKCSVGGGLNNVRWMED